LKVDLFSDLPAIKFESARFPSRRQKLEKVGQIHCFQRALDRH
jgi:hypothetical protein